MCIIIDTNALHCVFDNESKNHKSFEPILTWIIEGKGKIVYGGTKYKEELRKSVKYLKIIGQLNRSRKTIAINDNLVDDYQKELEKKVKNKDFDDPHIVAIAYVSKCKLICSMDKRSFAFLTFKDFYPKSSHRPKIYSALRNKKLLSDNNIVKICLPCEVLNKADREFIRSVLN